MFMYGSLGYKNSECLVYKRLSLTYSGKEGNDTI